MLAGRLREQSNIEIEMLSSGEHTTNKTIVLRCGVTEEPASGPAHSSGAGDTQDQGLRFSYNAQLWSPVELIEEHISAESATTRHYALHIALLAKDVTPTLISNERGRLLVVTSNAFELRLSVNKADNRGMFSVKACKIPFQRESRRFTS